MKKILILGGFGFMGKNINNCFTDSNFIIYNESRRTGCDLLDYNSFLKKLTDINPDIIINCAAHVGSISYVDKFAGDVVTDNIQMYINLYKGVKEINPNIIIINPISNCSYPGIIDVQNESDWWNGQIHESVESYGGPKKISFTISECYKKQFGVKTINLIIPNAYGPFDYVDEMRTHAMNGLILRMLKTQKNSEKIFSVWGSGKPIREWIYMPDLSNIIKKIVEEELYDLPNPINIGQENGISINDSVNIIKTLLKMDVEIVHDLSKKDGAPIKVLGKTTFVKFFNDFQFTNIIDGISNTIEYYKEKI